MEERERKEKKEMAHTITKFFILDFINMNWTEEEEKICIYFSLYKLSVKKKQVCIANK
jgi:hypothetical protein